MTNKNMKSTFFLFILFTLKYSTRIKSITHDENTNTPFSALKKRQILWK